jgi:hypothetical protein
MENPKQNVNTELSEFQGSLNHAAKEEFSFRTSKSRRGYVVEPSLHT